MSESSLVPLSPYLLVASDRTAPADTDPSVMYIDRLQQNAARFRLNADRCTGAAKRCGGQPVAHLARK